VHQRQMDLLYRIILFAGSALPIRRLEVAHFAPFNIGGRCVRLWSSDRSSDGRAATRKACAQWIINRPP
jgi:hypothetical protein